MTNCRNYHHPSQCGMFLMYLHPMPHHHQVCRKCLEGYNFGNLFTSILYTKFLASDRNVREGTRNKTHCISGRDCQGLFQSTFQLPQDSIESLAEKMIKDVLITPTQQNHSRHVDKSEASNHGCTGCIKTWDTILFLSGSNTSKYEHRIFFHKFIGYFFEHHKSYIDLPRNGEM